MPGAARKDDPVVGVDIHIVMIPNPTGESPVPLPHPFNGKIAGGVSTDVKIDGKPAAIMGAEVQNSPSHIAMGPRFQKNPTNKGKVLIGSPTVAAYDLDGASGVGANDLSAWLTDFGSGQPYGRSDFDCSGGVG